MSKDFMFLQAYEGACIATSYAQIRLDQAIQEFGKGHKIEYPGTGYHLPVITALDGTKVETLGQIVKVLNDVKTECIRTDFTLEGAKLNGKATLYAAEIIEAIEYLDRPAFNPPWTGFIPDTILRSLGLPLVDGSISGVAIICGKAKDNATALEIFRTLQSKGMLIVLCNEIIEQLLDEGVKLGAEALAVPLGNFTQLIHVVNFALRAALAFGGVKPGDEPAHTEYQAKRIKAFVLALGNQDNVRIAAEFGAMYLGHPTITDQPLDEEIPDFYLHESDPKKMVALGMELRGIKPKTMDIDVPILLGPAFEGESIRRPDMQVEFGGKYTTAFEWLTMVDDKSIEDGRVTVDGPDIDSVEVGGNLPLGIKVMVYGRKMKEEFESVLERRLHDAVNFGEGLFHAGQRDIIWCRISKKAFGAGIRLKHLGEIIIGKLKMDFPAIVDRVEVTLITDKAKVEKELEAARKVYTTRDERTRGLTDEKVDTFYSCKLCQSFAPNHICIVTPERVGLCGAVNWLDARATNEIDPNGPCTAIDKGTAEDAKKGLFPNVNEYLYTATNKQLEAMAIYSFMDMPMTSCGCFEAILALFSEGNGIMITTRDYAGMTPCGMTFSTLAGSVGGGAQTPGFMGFGRQYVVSKKFISGDGGIARICWMPKELKEYLRKDFVARSVEEGLGEDFIDKIADEEIGIDPDAVLAHLQKVGHPALKLDPIV